jgi:hypothetical protein
MTVEPLLEGEYLWGVLADGTGQYIPTTRPLQILFLEVDFSITKQNRYSRLTDKVTERRFLFLVLCM